MYKIKVLSREDPSENKIEDLSNAHEAASYKFDPDDIINSEIPPELNRISMMPENMAELKKNGKTSFSYTRLVTVSVEKS